MHLKFELLCSFYWKKMTNSPIFQRHARQPASLPGGWGEGTCQPSLASRLLLLTLASPGQFGCNHCLLIIFVLAHKVHILAVSLEF